MLGQFDTEQAEIFAARLFQESLMRDTSSSEISERRPASATIVNQAIIIRAGLKDKFMRTPEVRF
jgi:hypothetical protein